MSRTLTILAVVTTALLATSVLTGGGLAVNDQSPTEIAQCTTIDEPGSYVLTSDLTYGGYTEGCIDINADDVTLDGNGHTISYDTSGGGPYFAGAAIGVHGDDVTVRNVTFGDHARLGVGPASGVIVENNRFNWSMAVGSSRNVTIRNNVFENGDSEVDNSSNVSLVGNTIDGVSVTISNDAANVTARDNDGSGRLVIDVRGGEAVVRDNSLGTVDVAGYDGTSLDVDRNHVQGMDVSSNDQASVTNNTVDGGGLSLGGTTDDMRVAHNTVTDSDVGVYIAGGYDTGPKVTLVRNVVTGNRIGVKTYSNRPQIHWNDLSGNGDYGVVYTQDTGVVNATNNYWGDRPSSADDPDAPFEDPTTGALANGNGSAVSEGAAPAGVEPGIANVHFDTWLDAAPSAGVVTQSSNDGGTGQTTTTATTTSTTSTTATTTTATTTTEATTSTTSTSTTATTTGTATTTTGTTTTPEPTTTPATTTTAGNSTTTTPTTTVCEDT